MNSGKQVDNSNLKSKLDLRRHFLRKYHADGGLRVFDCCQATGRIWSILRKEFPTDGYWGVDLKPKPGRLKVDSVRVLQQPGLNCNVIDIDTYGRPWKHLSALVPNIAEPLTIFLTIGVHGLSTERISIASLGLGDLSVPPGILIKLNEIATHYAMFRICEKFVEIEEVAESPPGSTARYIGLRVRKRPGAPASAPRHHHIND